MRRYLLNLRLALLLLLLVALVAAWIRSHCAADLLGRRYPTSDSASHSLHSYAGELRFLTLHPVPREVNALAVNRGISLLGFSRGESGPPDMGSGIYLRTSWIGVPYWFLSVLTGAVALAAGASLIRHRRQQYRLQNGLCPACGYDLRATSHRCPECGTLATANERRT